MKSGNGIKPSIKRYDTAVNLWSFFAANKFWKSWRMRGGAGGNKQLCNRRN